MLRYGRHPAATVYDSIGEDFFIALAPGWLNLGLWEGDGSDPAEAAVAVRRLVETIAEGLPHGVDVLDVGNGLAAQDPVIAAVAETRRLVALNITLSQLVAGRPRLAEAGAHAVNGDATRLPFADGFVRRRDQRGGRVPLPVARAVLRRDVPRPAAGRRADDVRHPDVPLPARTARAAGRAVAAARVGSREARRGHAGRDRASGRAGGVRRHRDGAGGGARDRAGAAVRARPAAAVTRRRRRAPTAWRRPSCCRRSSCSGSAA